MDYKKKTWHNNNNNNNNIITTTTTTTTIYISYCILYIMYVFILDLHACLHIMWRTIHVQNFNLSHVHTDPTSDTLFFTRLLVYGGLSQHIPIYTTIRVHYLHISMPVCSHIDIHIIHVFTCTHIHVPAHVHVFKYIILFIFQFIFLPNTLISSVREAVVINLYIHYLSLVRHIIQTWFVT